MEHDFVAEDLKRSGIMRDQEPTNRLHQCSRGGYKALENSRKAGQELVETGYAAVGHEHFGKKLAEVSGVDAAAA